MATSYFAYLLTRDNEPAIATDPVDGSTRFMDIASAITDFEAICLDLELETEVRKSLTKAEILARNESLFETIGLLHQAQDYLTRIVIHPRDVEQVDRLRVVIDRNLDFCRNVFVNSPQ